MNNFKRAFIFLLLIFFCSGCTSAQTNFSKNEDTESEERDYKITSTEEYTMADIVFNIPSYFVSLDEDSDAYYKWFTDDEAKYPILGLAEVDDELTTDNINEFVNGYLDSDDLEGFLDSFDYIGSGKFGEIKYNYVYSSGTFILSDDSRIDGDTNFYFLSNNNKSKFAVIVYIHFNDSKYDYESVIHKIIENVEITDKVESEEAKASDSTTSNNENESSLTGIVPSTNTTTPTITTGQKNALASAKSYLSFMAFSYSGLIEQLEYEGYSQEEATYAADNCGADWNEQAAASAKSYLNSMSFSRQGLIDQLIYEGFSQEQAEYGVTQAGY